MRKLVHKLRAWFVFMTSQRVLEAINAGKSYAEVMAIVEEEMAQ